MIIDFHTHAFPDKLAHRALGGLAERIGYEPLTDGTVDGLIRKMDEWGIDRSVICNIATNPKQQDNVNAFALETSEARRQIYSLGSVHPDNDKIEDTLKMLKLKGVPGIKVHPDYMGYEISDSKFDPIFDLCSELGLFVITHAGMDVYSPKKIHATPKMISDVAARHPKLKLIAAHFGGNLMWEDVIEHICGKDIWIDTSLAYAEGVDQRVLKDIIFKHSPSRILYGSDTPWCNSGENVRFIEEMDLGSDLEEKVFFKNALDLLKK